MTQFAQQNDMVHSINILLRVKKMPHANLASSRAFIIASVRFKKAYKVE